MAPGEIVAVRVYGTPAPQGSKRHVGKGVMVESSKKVKPWREAVKAAVLDSRDGAWGVVDTPVVVRVVFILDRPKAHYRTGRHAGLLRDNAPAVPARKPDIDKLVRATLDALKDAGTYRDDSLVVKLVADKVYAGRDNGPPGAYVTVLDWAEAGRG
jgi:crossover junction endodeoxyribonuclease RusA